ncbi:hypothetical protein VMCG_00833 [Cytospora schulzeri]|uniref:C2H2-type domain-containing protein n=1 Tax=Cytospora schulzeri TaxID=448051 RepID=A0A423X7M3_9PEZI|nr:hypothetical protein VMCG_00833 [Valsa malicola]
MGNDAGPKLESATTTLNMSNTPPSSTDPDVTAPQGDDAEASTITVNTKTPTANFPPPKTDKPRPHGCTTCGRAFARLEHLKRHERSHTKEKPFECPECKRCFARRDLLLRHQQKLHQSTAPSSRPRNRRESASGVQQLGQSRARKNSVAGPAQSAPANPASMRPRANTISVIDGAAMQMMGAANPPVARMPPTHSRHNSLIGLPFHYSQGQYPGMSNVLGHRGVQHGLPKLETNGLGFDPGLRTAPPHAIFRNDFSMDNMFGSHTIDPQALHLGMDSPQSIGVDPLSPVFHGLPDLSNGSAFGLDDFLLSDFAQGLSFNNMADNAVDGSSPSAISTASPGGMSDAMIDGSNNPVSTAPNSSSAWAPAMVSPHMANSYSLDFPSQVFPDLMNGAPVSPHPMQHGMLSDAYFTPPPSALNSGSPSMMPNLNSQNINQTLNFGTGPETPTSLNGNNTYGTSPVSTITDSTRNAILGALSSTASLHSTLTNRRASFSLQTASLSAHAQASPSLADTANSLPSTQNLQRFVAAYLTYFHPHLPFLHIPTLSFEIPARIANGNSSSIGGPACLVLSMAAIGALFETEHDRARELFEMAKKMIQTYLEQRRKANVRKAGFRGSSSDRDTPSSHDSSTDTPVWLVQSMLLNVVYGHNCGDKRAGEIASTHCAALVSLAQGADLLRPSNPHGRDEQDAKMSDVPDEHTEWIRWKATEERKRTLYSIFILSSLLVSAYNHSPALTNSEVLLDLPCDEDFFEAETSAVFNARGGVAKANQTRVTFHDALGELLRTNEKQRKLSMSNDCQSFGSDFHPGDLPPTTLKPSSFGCLVLINALHNYIWETRQRHHSEVWTNEETEKMHRHIEPALKAWQAAWASNPHHSLKRPNPLGKGPLSADAIPLLDLAYVRLYVNLARSKDKFWQRDWDGMAEELARGSEITQHAEHSPSNPPDSVPADQMDVTGSAFGMIESQPVQSPLQQPLVNRTTSRREKHLRKAAFFAADSLSMANKLGLTFADLTCRDLPLQAALCAFDCAQVLAEWVATVQDRIGQYLGILGQDEVELFQVPAIMLLEEEDVQLLRKVQEVLNGLEKKMKMEFVPGIAGGYAVKILRVTAHMLDKAAVWPARAEKSVKATE